MDRALINEIAAAAANNELMDRFKGRSTLRLIQSISTIPGAFPTHLNMWVNKVSLEAEELAQVRLKIEELRRQLASLQAGHWKKRFECERGVK